MKIRNAISVAATAMLLLGCVEAGVVKAIGETVTGGDDQAPQQTSAEQARRFMQGDAPTLGGVDLAALPAAPDRQSMSDIWVYYRDGRTASILAFCGTLGPCSVNALGTGRIVQMEIGPLTDSTDRVVPVMHTGIMNTAFLHFGDDPNPYAYGAWMDYTAFAVRAAHVLSLPELGIHDPAKIVSAEAVGTATGRAPQSLGPEGSAMWNGTMIGHDGTTLYQGIAGLRMNFKSQTVDVRFRSIRSVETGAEHAGFGWDAVPVTDEGEFLSVSRTGRLHGSFHGPDHIEAGGTFTRPREMVGAFGARRLGLVPCCKRP